MTNGILDILKTVLAILPFVALCLLSKKINLNRNMRNRQFLMPVLALIFVIICLSLMRSATGWILDLLHMIPNWIRSLLNASWMPDQVEAVIRKYGAPIFHDFLQKLDWNYWIFYIANTVAVIAYFIFKGICLGFMRVRFRKDSALHDRVSGLFYEYFPEKSVWCLKDSYVQPRLLFKVVYYAAVILSSILMLVTGRLYTGDLLADIYYPVAGVLVIGELYFYLDGITKREYTTILGEDEESYKIVNYSLLRKYLRNIFGDKLLSENTNVNNTSAFDTTNEELLERLSNDEDRKVENFATFYSNLNKAGFRLDHNYLFSSLDLLNGKSILFNNPFYQDLIPYAFYPMNRVLLSRKKVLVVLGRHAIEDDIVSWLQKGISSVTNIPFLWKINALDEKEKKTDIGIVTRSRVIDARVHDANSEFLREVGFVVIIEPSKLISTAQIGLNLLIKKCKGPEDREIVFCMCDKNCDGLVDAMSHALMTSITEVSATNKHLGTSSYMCWEADNEYLHHRLLPNISRYLGIGTELSFAALKNQVSRTYWYGGDSFPVTDIKWIDRQYYFDLMRFAALPASQENMNEYFVVTPNMWSAEVSKNNYFTVEDEDYNMFEVLRDFSTRSTEQGFINVVSSDYLLKDYMASNSSIFETDAKAIPYLVADYARTHRNVILRLMLLMSVSGIDQEAIIKEFTLIGLPILNLQEQLWLEIYKAVSTTDDLLKLPADYQLAVAETADKTIYISESDAEFTIDIIRVEERYNFEIGKMETLYSISDSRFIKKFVYDLKSSSYVAEDEKGEKYFLGSELSGHIYQKYLPGQFFTFNGKYYEMLYLTTDNQVLVRRAADHIHGRPAYRQLREYTLSSIRPSEQIGATKDIDGIRICEEFADITVSTPGYYRMERYNDFHTAKKILFEGEKSSVPKREYRNKQILRIDLPDQDGTFTPAVRYTITLLMNEIFRTLFADNQPYICAVTDDSHLSDDAGCKPLTYSVTGDESCFNQNSIYIIEDSQLDIGLIIAVERNLKRIMQIIHDYISWNKREIAISLMPKKTPEPMVIDPSNAPEDMPKKDNIFKRAFKKIGNFFKKIGNKIKSIFKRKKKEEPEPEQPNIPEEPPVTPEEPPVTPEQYPATPEQYPITPEQYPEMPEQYPVTPEQYPATPEQFPEMPEQYPATPEQYPEMPEQYPATSEQYPEMPELYPATPEQYSEMPEQYPATPDVPDNTEMNEGQGEEPAFAPADAPGLTEVTEEQDKKDPFDFTRQPYHKRYYLMYGYAGEPETIDVNATLDYLTGLGFNVNPLKDARNGRRIARYVEATFKPNKQNARYCDFCGNEIFGVEYETLADGRDRCISCSRTAIKTEKEFKKIFEDVKRNMESFFGIKLNTGIRVEMVNSQKLHRRLKKAFVPTPYQDGRVLGVAIKDKNGFTLMIENGSPRLSAMLTIAHELTHIWQYVNWKDKLIKRKYGRAMRLEIYEGMAKWVEIQYAYLINEPSVAKREEIVTVNRGDEYGNGYIRYRANYPLSTGTVIVGNTPFMNIETPLDPMYCGEVTIMLDPDNGSRGYDDLDDIDDIPDIPDEDIIPVTDQKKVFDEVHLRDPENVRRYAYEQLTDSEKELYTTLYNAYLNFETEITDLPDWLTETSLDRIRNYVQRDHPEVFWVAGKYHYFTDNSTGKVTKLQLIYCMSRDEADRRNARIAEEVSGFLSGITAEMSDYDAVMSVYKNIIDRVDYDSLELERAGENTSDDEPDDLRSIYGVFVNRKAVCAGYAKATQYLLNKLGFECVYVTGKGKQERHAWNLLNLEGDYYYMDTTWDDHSNTKDGVDSSGEITYDYFCVTTKEILRDHTPDDMLPLPECTADRCNYYLRSGLLLTSFNFAAVRALFKDSVARGECTIALKAKDETVYQQIYDSLITQKKVGDIIRYLNLDSATRVSTTYAYSSGEEKLKVAVVLTKL